MPWLSSEVGVLRVELDFGVEDNRHASSASALPHWLIVEVQAQSMVTHCMLQQCSPSRPGKQPSWSNTHTRPLKDTLRHCGTNTCFGHHGHYMHHLLLHSRVCVPDFDLLVS